MHASIFHFAFRSFTLICSFSPACQSLDLYKKMVAFVMAYSFTEPAGKAKEADGNASREEEDSDTEDVEGTLPPMMVPMADILNHIAKNNAALTFEVDALRMVSTRDIRKVRVIFMCICCLFCNV